MRRSRLSSPAYVCVCVCGCLGVKRNHVYLNFIRSSVSLDFYYVLYYYYFLFVMQKCFLTNNKHRTQQRNDNATAKYECVTSWASVGNGTGWTEKCRLIENCDRRHHRSSTSSYPPYRSFQIARSSINGERKKKLHTRREREGRDALA